MKPAIDRDLNPVDVSINAILQEYLTVITSYEDICYLIDFINIIPMENKTAAFNRLYVIIMKKSLQGRNICFPFIL